MNYWIEIGCDQIQYFHDQHADSVRWHCTILLHEIGHAVCGHDCLRPSDEIPDEEYLRLQIEADRKLVEWGQGEALIEWLEDLVRFSQELLTEELPEELSEARAQVGEATFLEWQESARHQLEHDLPRLEAARRAMANLAGSQGSQR
jgi:hypothetical protein